MLLSPTLPTDQTLKGGEQARVLRALAAHRVSSTDQRSNAVGRCRTVVVAGGKGGVGRSVIALNLAIVLSNRGAKVGLLDASPDLGNIDLLCALDGYWSLPHVVQGSRQLVDVLHSGPCGVTILSGANCLAERQSETTQFPTRVFEQLQDFESKLDWLIVDASSGSSATTREFALAGDDTLLVTTPEPTAVAEAYASAKALSSGRCRLGLVVNQADSEQQAQQILDRLKQSCHSFLRIDLHRRGYVPRDKAVARSVCERIPFIILAPESPAAAAIQRLSQRWIRALPADTPGFFSKLLMHQDAGRRRHSNQT